MRMRRECPKCGKSYRRVRHTIGRDAKGKLAPGIAYVHREPAMLDGEAKITECVVIGEVL
jgi:hypothetical protein